jgi:hypothetical protein
MRNRYFVFVLTAVMAGLAQYRSTIVVLVYPCR